MRRMLLSAILATAAPFAIWTGIASGRASASGEEGTRSDYVTYGTGMFGFARGEIARASVVNHAMLQGMEVKFEFLDRNGGVVAESGFLPVPLNHAASFDLDRPGSRRMEVRVQVEIRGLSHPRYTPGFIGSLEVLDRLGRTQVRVGTFAAMP